MQKHWKNITIIIIVITVLLFMGITSCLISIKHRINKNKEPLSDALITYDSLEYGNIRIPILDKEDSWVTSDSNYFFAGIFSGGGFVNTSVDTTLDGDKEMIAVMINNVFTNIDTVYESAQETIQSEETELDLLASGDAFIGGKQSKVCIYGLENDTEDSKCIASIVYKDNSKIYEILIYTTDINRMYNYLDNITIGYNSEVYTL